MTAVRRRPCMSDEEWEAWVASEASLPMKDRASSPCADCLPDFASAMRKVDRCDGTPLVVEQDAPLPPRKPFRPKTGRQSAKRGRVRELTDAGWSTADIAEALSIGRSTVERYRRQSRRRAA